MKVVNRQQTLDQALASAKRLAAKHGNVFAIVEDRSPSAGGDEFPYVVMGLADFYDRKAA